MNNKKILGLTLAVMMTASIIEAPASALAANADDAPSTRILTESKLSEAEILDKIDALERKSSALYKSRQSLWEKVDAAYNALPGNYDYEKHDDAAFIRSLKSLTQSEKEALIADGEALDKIDAELDSLYALLPQDKGGEMPNLPALPLPLNVDPKLAQEMIDLEDKYEELAHKHDELWAKVDEAYANLPDNYNFDNFVEADFIRGLTNLTADEKKTLLDNIAAVDELHAKLDAIYQTIWGDDRNDKMPL